MEWTNTRFRTHDPTELSDAELIRRYVSARGDDEFSELVRRHGPLVLGVCRRVLRNQHDAEDAFQATFLVFLRKAEHISPPGLVGNWLFGVAYRTALKARALSVRQRARERPMSQTPEPAEVPADGLWRELQPLLDRELSRLPDKYRAPIVLCDLQGRSHKEAARELGWPVGTLSGRLSRARAQLARRLARQGLLLSAGSAVVVLTQETASAHVPPALLASTVQAAGSGAVGPVAAATPVSTHVATLAEGVLRSMFYSKLKLVATVIMALGTACAGAAIAAHALQGNPKEVVAHRDRGRDGREPDRVEAADATVQELLEKRHGTLQQLVEVAESEFEAGLGTFAEVLRADELLISAALELSDTDQQRLAIYNKAVELATEREQMITKQVRAGAGHATVADVLLATAHQLEVEIAYERAKARLGAPQ